MKVFVILSAIVAVTVAQGYGSHNAGNSYNAAASQASHYTGTEQQKPPIPILRSDSKHNHDGSYDFSYETGNGIVAAEQGYVKNLGQKDNEIQVAQGYFQYTGDDGIPISLKYVADENGFQPTGDHLPTPPPLPKEIIEALEKIANDPRQNDGDDGQYRADANSAGHYNAQKHAQPQQQQNYYNKY